MLTVYWLLFFAPFSKALRSLPSVEGILLTVVSRDLWSLHSPNHKHFDIYLCVRIKCMVIIVELNMI